MMRTVLRNKSTKGTIHKKSITPYKVLEKKTENLSFSLSRERALFKSARLASRYELTVLLLPVVTIVRVVVQVLGFLKSLRIFVLVQVLCIPIFSRH